MSDLLQYKSKKFKEHAQGALEAVIKAYPHYTCGYTGFAVILAGISMVFECIENHCEDYEQARDFKQVLKICLLDYVAQVDAIRSHIRPKIAKDAKILKMGDR